MRASIGVIALSMLLGGLIFLGQPEVAIVWSGLLIRVGPLLAVIWLAYPQLLELRHKVPSILLGAAITAALVMAVRPNLGRIIVTLLVVVLVAGFVLKWIARKTGARR